MSHNECRLSPYAFSDDTTDLRAELSKNTIDRFGSAIWFDKWMMENYGVWHMGLTEQMVSGKEERTNEFWQFLRHAQAEFTTGAEGALI